MRVPARGADWGEGSDSGWKEEKPGRARPIAVGLVALVAVAALLYTLPNLPGVLGGLSQFLSGFTSPAGPSLNYSVYSPIIQGGSANISYPPHYDALASYALSLINQDRANFSAAPVALARDGVAQQHADSMLRFDYFSHYDTQGYKPYMRYTLLGGRAAVQENIAYVAGDRFSSVSDLEGGIKTLEHLMMYEDQACCNNGHKLNIINALHNFVSVGVAYNGTTLYFDEEFENVYANMTFTVSSQYAVTMAGTLTGQLNAPAEAIVTYDSTPQPETRQQLNNGPREYDPGTVIGGVMPPCAFGCPVFSSGVTVYAGSWQFSSGRIDVEFSLHDFVAQNGPGVYTIYIVTGADTSTAITTLSVFVT